ncbi:MAG: dTDP-glucose 4,6-dehydratase [Myxococcota bacterium]|nr:dTDP-glucose 4,6-dehydratase [Myxococcota bacterium]
MGRPFERSDTLLVTGGAGFIGSNFVRTLLRETPSRVVVVDKLTYAGTEANLVGLDPDRFRLVRADIADAETLAKLLADLRPRAIVNLAAETHVDRSIDGPAAFVQTNVVGCFVLLEAARALVAGGSEAEASEFRFLHVSTDEVFGSLGGEGAFDESTPYAPSSPYSASKAGADHFVRAYHRTYGLPTLLTNCSNNYGPRQFPEKLVPLTILNALEGRELPIYGDGRQVRDWLYVEDHCAGLLTVLQRGTPGESYNIGGNEECTNLELVDRLCEQLQAIRPVDPDRPPYVSLKAHVEDRPGHDRRYAIDSSRIQRELGWRPRHSLAEGLGKTVAWYLANGDWCRQAQARGYDRERLGLAVDP